MVVIEGKQKEAAATEEVVSKAPISLPKEGESHVWNGIFFPSPNWDLVYLTV